MKRQTLALAALAGALTAGAEVALPQFFTDSMVVQRDATLIIPGTARRGATVKVTPSWDPAATVKTKADRSGRFQASLATPPAGGPYTITIDDGSRSPKVLSDVLSGDVWLCSGQSNMEMPVAGWGKVMDYRQEVASANSPEVRLLQVQKQTSYSPQADTKVNMGGWRPATPETVANFSSIGYFFGRDLNIDAGIPVGVIDCTWGGTPIEAWSSYETLQDIGEFGDELKAIADCGFDSDALMRSYEQRYADWVALTMENDIKFDIAALQPGWGKIEQPAIWEDSALPGFDGVVWLQRTFNVPSGCLPSGSVPSDAQIHLSVIDDDDVTYVNGVEVGKTVGYNLPRVYTIPAGVLKEGENVVTVRVSDYQGGGGLWGDAAEMYVSCGGKKIPLAGTWQYKVGVDAAQLPPMPISPINASYPTVLYNAMLHPLTVMPVKGVLWYQGCANVGYEKMYSKAFKAMIEAWRRDFRDPQMPFYFVQLAGYLQPQRLQPQSQWAALRQAQKDALDLENTGMAVAIDLGNPDDIHPKNKQAVADRLLKMALRDLYDRDDITARAPEVKDVKVEGRNMVITFDGPVTNYGGGQGYAVLGADGRWAQGYARQKSRNTIEVSSDEVDSPVEVRYLWADYPEGNLRGTTGLPVAPFAAKKN